MRSRKKRGSQDSKKPTEETEGPRILPRFIAIQFTEDLTVSVIETTTQLRKFSLRRDEKNPDILEAKHQGIWYKGSIVASGGKMFL